MGTKLNDPNGKRWGAQKRAQKIITNLESQQAPSGVTLKLVFGDYLNTCGQEDILESTGLFIKIVTQTSQMHHQIFIFKVL